MTSTLALAGWRRGAVTVPLAAMAGPDALRDRVVGSGTRVGIADAATHARLLEDEGLREEMHPLEPHRLPFPFATRDHGERRDASLGR